MAKAVTASRARNFKPAAAEPSDAPKIDVRALAAPTLGAVITLAREADKRRDELSEGKYDIDTTLRINGFIRVAADSEGARSVTPNLNELVGYLLGQMSGTVQKRILTDLPAAFEQTGAMPETDLLVLDLAEALLKRLRRQVPQVRRGAITGELLCTAR